MSLAGSVDVEVRARIEQLEQGFAKARATTTSFGQHAQRSMRSVERNTVQSSRRVSQGLDGTTRAAQAANDNFKQLDGVTEELGRSAQRLGNRLGPVGSILTRLGPAGITAAAGLAAITSTVVSGARSLLEFETALLRVEGMIIASGNAAGVTVPRIERFARELETATLTTRNEVMQAATVLMTFRSVSGEAFEQTIRLAQDMSSVLGTDLVSATRRLGLAMEDPVLGMQMLRRSQVILAPAIQEQIRLFHEQGRTMEANALLLQEIENRFGGLAEREAAQLAGSLDRLTQNWRNLREEIARSIGATRAWQSAVDAVNRGLQRGIDNLRELTAAERFEQIQRELGAIDRSLRDMLVDPDIDPSAFERTLDTLTRPGVALLRRQRAALMREREEVERRMSGEITAEFEAREQARIAQAEAATDRVVELHRQAEDRIRELSESRIDVVRRQEQEALEVLEHQRRQGADPAQIERAIDARREQTRREIEEIERPLREAEARRQEAEQRAAEARAAANEQVIAGLMTELRLIQTLSGEELERERFILGFVSRLNDATETRVALARELAGSLWEERQAQQASSRAAAEATRIQEGIARQYRGIVDERDGEVASLHRWRAETLASLDRAAEGYEEFARQVEAIFQARLPAARDADLRNSREAIDGARRFLKDYIDDIDDAATRTEQAFETAFRGIEDSLVDVFTTGRFEVTDFANHVQRELARMAVQQVFMRPLAGFLQGGGGGVLSMIGSMFHGGGIAGQTRATRPISVPTESPLVGLPRFHNGRVPGLRQNEVLSVLEDDEEVVTRDNPRHIFNVGRSPSAGVTFAPGSVVIQAQDLDSFRQSEGVVSAQLSRAVERGTRQR